ncbi:MAG: NAD(P)-binding domain-containing protein [Porticoccaceae bacterium]
MTVRSQSPAIDSTREQTSAAQPGGSCHGADIAISMVSRTDDVLEVLTGTHGAASLLSEGCLFIDMSTIDSGATAQLERNLNARGIEFTDARVSGGEGGAINAALTILLWWASLRTFSARQPCTGMHG